MFSSTGQEKESSFTATVFLRIQVAEEQGGAHFLAQGSQAQPISTQLLCWMRLADDTHIYIFVGFNAF